MRNTPYRTGIREPLRHARPAPLGAFVPAMFNITMLFQRGQQG